MNEITEIDWYDGLIHDMAVQDLPILVTVDRGGIVGPDGPTHQGI